MHLSLGRCRYEDGDTEHLTFEMLLPLLLDPTTPAVPRLRASQEEEVEMEEAEEQGRGSADENQEDLKLQGGSSRSVGSELFCI